jgi:hypothetical protein
VLEKPHWKLVTCVGNLIGTSTATGELCPSCRPPSSMLSGPRDHVGCLHSSSLMLTVKAAWSPVPCCTVTSRAALGIEPVHHASEPRQRVLWPCHGRASHGPAQRQSGRVAALARPVHDHY